jgi:hypothetical protein
MKLKHKQIALRYADHIDALYAEEHSRPAAPA